VTAARSSARDLPLAPTLLCLFATGWVSSFVVAAASAGHAYPASVPPLAFLLGEGLVEALVGAVVIRILLKNVVGCDIPYGSAFAALAGGSLVRNAFVWATSPSVQHGGSSGVLPTGGLVLFTVVPALASMGVSYWLLQLGFRERVTTPSPPRPPAERGRVSDDWADEAPAQRSTQTRWGFGGASYDELVSAARETSLGLVEVASRADPADVPDRISEGLPTLQSITANLEKTTPPVAVAASVHAHLISGLQQLQEDLVDTAASAAITANTRVTQRGWLLPSSVDVSDGGSRYRWELSQSPGLKMVRETLSELYTLGVGTTW
jgi:hypothetical protein